MTGKYYSALLGKVRVKIVEERRGMISKGVLFLQNNPRAHKSHSNKLCNLRFDLVKQSPCSPDLASSDYHLRRRDGSWGKLVCRPRSIFFKGLKMC